LGEPGGSWGLSDMFHDFMISDTERASPRNRLFSIGASGFCVASPGRPSRGSLSVGAGASPWVECGGSLEAMACAMYGVKVKARSAMARSNLIGRLASRGSIPKFSWSVWTAKSTSDEQHCGGAAVMPNQINLEIRQGSSRVLHSRFVGALHGAVLFVPGLVLFHKQASFPKKSVSGYLASQP
jgi:hypothetical protein